MLLSQFQHPRLPPVGGFRRIPAILVHRIPSLSVRSTAVDRSGAPAPTYRDSHCIHLSQSASTPMDVTVGCRRNPELGLASVLFVISMVLGSFLSLFVISLPVLYSFRKLAASTAKLSKCASEEVPGTLLSLKLSELEINDMTRQLNNLTISGGRYVKKERRNIPNFRGGSSETVIS